MFIEDNPVAFVPVIEKLQKHFDANGAVEFPCNPHFFDIKHPAVDWFTLPIKTIKWAIRFLEPGCPSWIAVSSAGKQLGIIIPLSGVNVQTSESTSGGLPSAKVPSVASASASPHAHRMFSAPSIQP